MPDRTTTAGAIRAAVKYNSELFYNGAYMTFLLLFCSA